MSQLGLIDYGMGNLHSVQRGFERLGARVQPVHTAADMATCDALVLPGVGAFDPAMERLRAGGLEAAIQDSCSAGRPLLGICLGLQLLFEGSEEGQASGLALLPGWVRALPPKPGHPIPHMGWAPLVPATPSPLLPADAPESWVYFVHSYAADPTDPACTTAWVDWGGQPVTAAVWRGTIAACQFHPEKSGPVGEDMLRRWLQWVGQR
ncbi:MAG: imidazole glycerol phosphate synthase subunit HisH [Synechococcaceae cyanobacterium]|jgi:glutamine amidotransferase